MKNVKEYKVLLEPQDAAELEDFKKKYFISYSGIFIRAMRLFMEMENQKTQLLQEFQHGQKSNTMK